MILLVLILSKVLDESNNMIHLVVTEGFDVIVFIEKK